MPLMTEYELTEEIQDTTEHYFPNEAVCEEIGAVSLVLVSSPQFSGKTSVIETIEGMDAGFRMATSFTTRDQRTGESPFAYHFIRHNEQTLRTIAANAMAGNYVQCTVHPNGRVYGSTPDDYMAPYAMLAPISTEVEKLEQLPFDEVIPIELACHPSDWLRFARERTAQTGEEISQKIIDEGIASLQWALDRGDQTIWVANNAGMLQATAAEVIRVSRGGEAQHPRARQLGELLLDYLCEL